MDGGGRDPGLPGADPIDSVLRRWVERAARTGKYPDPGDGAERDPRGLSSLYRGGIGCSGRDSEHGAFDSDDLGGGTRGVARVRRRRKGTGTARRADRPRPAAAVGHRRHRRPGGADSCPAKPADEPAGGVGDRRLRLSLRDGLSAIDWGGGLLVEPDLGDDGRDAAADVPDLRAGGVDDAALLCDRALDRSDRLHRFVEWGNDRTEPQDGPPAGGNSAGSAGGDPHRLPGVGPLDRPNPDAAERHGNGLSASSSGGGPSVTDRSCAARR